MNISLNFFSLFISRFTPFINAKILQAKQTTPRFHILHRLQIRAYTVASLIGTSNMAFKAIRLNISALYEELLKKADV